LANENSDYGYITFVIITIRFFPHLWLINGFVTRVTRRMPHVKKELITLPEHPRPSPVFIVVRVAWSLVFCVIFCRSLFVLLSFFIWPLYCISFFDIQILITPLVYSNFSRQVVHFLIENNVRMSVSWTLYVIICFILLTFNIRRYIPIVTSVKMNTPRKVVSHSRKKFNTYN
jgi:hypothetical protein